MSREIDERVVSMQFDNRKFEANAATTMSTLDKIEQKLNFKGAAKSFDELTDNASRVDLSPMASAASLVGSKFDAMSVVAISAINRVVNQAMGAGERIIKSLTIEPVTAGWDKYAQKTSSVQTIMAATAKDFDDVGEQMEFVNDKLDELSWYTDETSYSFNDMVSNIGKFTSNGVKLDTAVTAMQGIANWAGISGASVQEATRAMYNLSQALGTGTVKLIDWKSIENANMATAEFKEMAINSAVAEGKLKQVSDGLYKTMKGNEVSVNNFNEALSDGWFTSDVLMSTLDQYGRAVEKIRNLSELTGGTASESLQIVQDYRDGVLDIAKLAEEADVPVEDLKTSIAELADDTMQFSIKTFKAAQEAKTFREAIDATNEAVASGWSKSFEIIFGDYEQAKKLWTDFANTLYDVFAGPAEDRNKMLKAWAEEGGRDDLFDGIKAAWNSLYSVVTAVTDGWDKVDPEETGKKFAATTKTIKEFLESLQLSDSALKGIEETARAVFKPIKATLGLLKEGTVVIASFVSKARDLVDGLFSIGQSGVDAQRALGKAFGAESARRIIQSASSIKTSLASLQDRIDFSPITDALKNFVDFTGPMTVMGKVVENLMSAFGLVVDIIGKVLDFTNALISLAGSTNEARIALDKAFGTKNARKILESVAEIKRYFQELQEKMNFTPLGNAIKRAFDFTAPLESVRNLLSASTPMETLGGIVASLAGAFKMLFKNATAVFAVVGNSIGSFATGLLNGFSAISIDKIEKLFSVGALGGILYGVVQFVMKLKSSVRSFKEVFSGIGEAIESFTAKNDVTMVRSIATSIGILAASLFVLSTIDSGKLLGATAAIGIMFQQLIAAMGALESGLGTKKIRGIAKLESMMIVLSVSMLILAGALKMMASLSPGKLAEGLLGIAGVMIIFVKAVQKLSREIIPIATSSGALIGLAAAVGILTICVKKLAEVEWDELLRGLVGLAGILLELSLFLKKTKFDSISVKSGIALIAVAAAVRILAGAVNKMAELDTNELIKGLGAVGIMLEELVIFCNSLEKTTDMGKVGLGMLLLGTAMVVLVSAVEKLGSMSLGALATGLIAMGVALFEVSTALNVLPDDTAKKGAGLLVVAGAMVVLAAALRIMGGMNFGGLAVSLIALAGGLFIISTAMDVMQTSLPGAKALIVVSSALLIFATAMKILGSMSIGQVVVSLIALAGALAVLGGAAALLTPVLPSFLLMGEAMTKLGLGVAGVGIGLLALSAALVLLIPNLEALAVSAPLIFEGLGNGIIAFAGAVASGSDAIIAMFVTLLDSLLSALSETAPKLIDFVAETVVMCLDKLSAYLPQIIDSGAALIVNLLKGVSQKIPDLIGAALDVVEAFAMGIVESIPRIIEIATEFVVTFLDGFGQAIEDNTGIIVEKFIALGGHLINGLINGITGGVKGAIDAIGSVATNLKKRFSGDMEVHSPSKVFERFGGYLMKGLGIGIDKESGVPMESMSTVTEGMLSSTQKSLGINSGKPSAVFRDDVGVYIVQGIAEGIKSDMTAEEVAKTKADNIKKAFQTELDSFKLDMTTIDKELALWSAVNSEASGSDAAQVKINAVTEKLKRQGQLVANVEAQWVAAQKEFGANSKEVQEFYNAYLDEKTTMANLSSQLIEARNSLATSQKEAQKETASQMVAYAQYMAEYQESLLAMGFTMEQIEQSARDSTGYGKVSEQVNEVQRVMDEFSVSVNDVVGPAIAAAGAQAKQTAVTTAKETTAQVQQTIETGTKTVVTTIANNTETESYTIGQNIVNGIIKGMADAQAALEEAAKNAANALMAAAKAALGIHSPSKEFEKLGKFSDMGFAKGLTKYASVAERASVSMGEDTISSLRKSINNISSYVSSNVDYNPSITPVLDFSEIQNGLVMMDGMLQNSRAVNLVGTISKAQSAANSMNYRDDNFGAAQPAVVNNTFTQNNYSPKALSRLDIYRQTKNQFAAAKGRVTTR